MSNPIKCYFTLGGINYKNGFVTSCPQQSDQLYLLKDKIKPSEIINTELFRKHRLSMMSSDWPSGCHLCRDVEAERAGKSMREGHEIPLLTHYNNDGTIKFAGLKHIELRFSNSCNLACLHCSEVYSSGWMSKLKNYVPDEEDYAHRLIQLTKEHHRTGRDDDLSIGLSLEDMYSVVQDLIDNFPNLEKVDFAGGEVLYQKQFFPCLEKLAEHPNAKNMWIFFHSNFNAKFDPNKLYELLKPFGKITIMLSVDAGKRIYPYFRTANWETLKSNIDKFKALDTDKRVLIRLVCTTSAYQIMDIVDVFESFLTLDIDRINSSIVYTPEYMNPALMMQEFSDHVLADLDLAKQAIENERARRMASGKASQYRSWVKNDQFEDIFTAHNALENIRQYVINHKTSKNEFDAFEVYIRKSDALWKQNFNDYFTNYKIVNQKIRRS